MDRFSSEPFAAPHFSRLDANEDGSCALETKGHDCLDFLVFHSADAIESHGEQHTDEWYQCTVCGERYTDAEVDFMYNPMPRKPVVPECAACGSQRKAVAIERTLSHRPEVVCCKGVA